MSRDIPAELKTQLDQQSISYTLLAFFDFLDGPQYLWAGPIGEDIVWDGQTWRGIGDLGSIDRISEPGDLKSARTIATLKLTPDLLDDVDIDGEANRGRAAEIRLLFFDTDNQFSDEIVYPFEMGGTRAEISESVGEAGERLVTESIQLTLLGRQDLLSRSLFRKQTHQDTLEINADDFGNEFASDPDMGTLGGGLSDWRSAAGGRDKRWTARWQ